jgi:hypothetical protein
MTLLEFNQWAFDHDGSSFADAPVQLTGFVAEGEGTEGSGWPATRSPAARPTPRRSSSGSSGRTATHQPATGG